MLRRRRLQADATGSSRLEGVFPLAPSFDHAGPMARIGRRVRRDDGGARRRARSRPRSTRSRSSTVGVAWLDRAEPLVHARVREAAELFPRRARGRLPARRGDRRRVHARGRRRAPRALRRVRGLLRRERAHEGRALPGAYGRRVRVRPAGPRRATANGPRRRWTASTSCSRPRSRSSRRSSRSTTSRSARTRSASRIPFNALGWPALALPCGPAEDGVPASLQIVGRPGSDALVLAAGARWIDVPPSRDALTSQLPKTFSVMPCPCPRSAFSLPCSPSSWARRRLPRSRRQGSEGPEGLPPAGQRAGSLYNRNFPRTPAFAWRAGHGREALRVPARDQRELRRQALV